MRFSTRSKMSILITFVTLLAVIGGFMVTGFIRGSAGQARAAATSSHTSLAKLHYRGTTQLQLTHSNASIANGAQPDEVGPDVNAGSSKVAVGTTSNPPTQNPNPPGNGFDSSNPGFSGFVGLTHADQRLANNGNQFSLEPPDQGLCAGLGVVIEPINDAVAVYSQVGHVILRFETLSQFFGLAPDITRSTPPVFGPFISDPKCYFDSQTQRWFLTELEIDTNPTTGAFGTHSSELIAVSQTSSPTGAWTIYAIDTTDDGSNNTVSHLNCPCFGDQPLIGADSNGFYVSTNEFNMAGTIFNGAQVYAVSKTGIEAAAASGGTLSAPTVVHIDASQALVPFGGLSYSVQPAESPSLGAEPNNGTEYFLSALQFGPAPLDNRIATWALTNTASLNVATPSVVLSFVVITSETYGQPPNATQKTSGPRPLATFIQQSTGTRPPVELLASNDDRMNQVVFATGLLWSGVNTIVQNGTSAPRVATAYFIVKPSWTTDGKLTASIAKQGYVAIDGANVLFPSIGVTASGQGVISFSVSGKNFFPSAAYALVDAVNGAGRIHIAAAGQLPDDGFSGYAAYGGAGVGRWGDYTAAVADGNNIWFAAEYIPNLPRTLLANWGTFVSKLHV